MTRFWAFLLLVLPAVGVDQLRGNRTRLDGALQLDAPNSSWAWLETVGPSGEELVSARALAATAAPCLLFAHALPQVLRIIFTPQVVAVLVALGINFFLPNIKAQMLPAATGRPTVGPLALSFTAAAQLGECAIPLCLISVGARISEMLVEYSSITTSEPTMEGFHNVQGSSSEDDEGSKSQHRALFHTAVLIAAVRIVLAPLVLFMVAYAYKEMVLKLGIHALMCIPRAGS
eukprot:Skav233517  [mRNA]  locus=scaffold1910:57277:71725:- [translate_table: standard]